MLVINRKKMEIVEFRINGKSIQVQILDIRSNKVRIGISAPEEVKIVRLQEDGSTRR